MKKWKVLFLNGGILLLVLVIYIVYSSPSEREISLTDLAVNPKVFPPGWTVKEGNAWILIPEKGLADFGFPREAGYRVLVFSGHENVFATHWLFRYQNQWQALEAFWRDYPKAFPKEARWQVPSDWIYHSSIADQFRFGCMIWENPEELQTRCVAMARYGEIISVLDLPLSARIISYEDIRHILQSIDQQIIHYLENQQSLTPLMENTAEQGS